MVEATRLQDKEKKLEGKKVGTTREMLPLGNLAAIAYLSIPISRETGGVIIKQWTLPRFTSALLPLSKLPNLSVLSPLL